jgi:DNA topoisomerase-6 subunit B
VLDVEWRRYGLSQPSGSLPVAPLVVMVHMASVWVPFTSESKEAIADYDEIRKEIKLGLLECGRKLQTYVNKRKRQKSQSQRRSVFFRYIDEVVSAVDSITPIDTEKLKDDLLKVARKRTALADVQLDENGKPVEAMPAKLGRDENTVIVESEETAPEGLFDEDDNEIAPAEA